MNYLALGDSMSIDRYTDVKGGGAVAQFHRSLGSDWTLCDQSFDGCTIHNVPLNFSGDLITITIGGNDLRHGLPMYRKHGLGKFPEKHLALMRALRERNPSARILVGNVYHPAYILGEREEALLKLANSAIAENAAAIDAKLIDICGAFVDHEVEYLCRWIEPNLLGASRIAELFAQAYRD